MVDAGRTRYEIKGSAAWITLSSPPTRNALSVTMVAELAGHLCSAGDDPAVRVIVLTGEGSAFYAGADLKNRGDMGEEAHDARHPVVGIVKLRRDDPKPDLCGVNGHAVGGGV